MRKNILSFFSILFFFFSSCVAEEFQELNEKDFDNPKSLTNQTFIITLGKSGTNLLISSIVNLTGRPVRTLFPGLPITNILQLDIDFSKKPIFFGHDYFGQKISVMELCKYGSNKLIMTHRNYKENILSYLVLSNQIKSLENEKTKLEKAFLDEILNEKIYFELYIERILLFEHWPEEYRFLVKFEDLLNDPGSFFPRLLTFLGEDGCYCGEFLENYNSFRNKLHEEYSKRGGYTGSRSDLNYFRKYVSSAALIQADNYVKKHYPTMWDKYLKDHAEVD